MFRAHGLVTALLAILSILSISCDSDPEAPATTTSSVSGTVVYAQGGAPAPGVDVIMEQCVEGGGMMGGSMMHEDWDHAQHMLTDDHGEFHFEYMHDHEHRYRVRAGDMSPGGMCYLDGGVENGIVLRIEGQ